MSVFLDKDMCFANYKAYSDIESMDAFAMQQVVIFN
jgi:hypothetical protein